MSGPGGPVAIEMVRAALDAAAAAAAADPRDVPVGAIVFDREGRELARAANAREATGDPTAHAEVLALRRLEIRRLGASTQDTGVTLVPLALYFSDGKAKLELALARGKRTYDKRQAIAERQSKRDADRAVAQRQRGES